MFLFIVSLEGKDVEEVAKIQDKILSDYALEKNSKKFSPSKCHYV